jgi:hypothetical protein
MLNGIISIPGVLLGTLQTLKEAGCVSSPFT